MESAAGKLALALPAESSIASDFARQQAKRLSDFAAEHHLPSIAEGVDTDADYLLQLYDGRIALHRVGSRELPIFVDFEAGKSEHRRQFGGGKGQQIARAVGLQGKVRPLVVDATAGMGADAYVLAGLGSELHLFERSPVVGLLLEDGLQRGKASGNSAVAESCSRMQLQRGDAIECLPSLCLSRESRSLVVYLDPMFPASGKSAAVNKTMRSFHDLVGKDSDAGALLEAADSLDPDRIVVKRPRKAPLLGDRKPSLQLTGKSGRFDIYAFRKLV